MRYVNNDSGFRCQNSPKNKTMRAGIHPVNTLTPKTGEAERSKCCDTPPPWRYNQKHLGQWTQWTKWDRKPNQETEETISCDLERPKMMISLAL